MRRAVDRYEAVLSLLPASSPQYHSVVDVLRSFFGGHGNGRLGTRQQRFSASSTPEESTKAKTSAASEEKKQPGALGLMLRQRNWSNGASERMLRQEGCIIAQKNTRRGPAQQYRSNFLLSIQDQTLLFVCYRFLSFSPHLPPKNR